MKNFRAPIYIFLFIGLVLLIKYYYIPSKMASAPGKGAGMASLPVNGVVVKGSAINQEIFASGSVLSNEEIELHPEVSGKLVQIFFKEGNKVNKGDLLVKINDADLQAALHKNMLEKKLADDRLKRNEKLLQMKGISEEEYESLQHSAASLDADRDMILAQIAKTEIRAPFNGTIGLKTVSEGSYVTPQTLIASLQQIDPAKIDFSIPEKYSALVKKGDEIIFTVGGSSREFKGNIYAIEPRVDLITRTVQLRALCPNSSAAILPGAFARITLLLREEKNALMIPTESIVPVLKGKQVYVFRNGRAESVKVETGIRNDSTIQVLSGIQENDTVITTGMMSLRPGVAINLTSVR